MANSCGYWMFYGESYENALAVRKNLRILLENLISSKILLPKKIYRNVPLVYNTIDELLDQIEATGYWGRPFEFGISGDTVIYTSNGEEIHHGIIHISNFRTSTQSFMLYVDTDHWLPMRMDEDYEFTWNLEKYQLNYHRIPALLKKLDEELGWENEDLSSMDEEFITLVAGYDFFIKESIIAREYDEKPNPDFDLDAYLAATKNAREKYTPQI
jgi:hypothetical protein